MNHKIIFRSTLTPDIIAYLNVALSLFPSLESKIAVQFEKQKLISKWPLNRWSSASPSILNKILSVSFLQKKLTTSNISMGRSKFAAKPKPQLPIYSGRRKLCINAITIYPKQYFLWLALKTSAGYFVISVFEFSSKQKNQPDERQKHRNQELLEFEKICI